MQIAWWGVLVARSDTRGVTYYARIDPRGRSSTPSPHLAFTSKSPPTGEDGPMPSLQVIRLVTMWMSKAILFKSLGEVWWVEIWCKSGEMGLKAEMRGSGRLMWLWGWKENAEFHFNGCGKIKTSTGGMGTFEKGKIKLRIFFWQIWNLADTKNSIIVYDIHLQVLDNYCVILVKLYFMQMRFLFKV